MPPWNSKDKKCCLYETPYVAEPMREFGDVIAISSTLRATSYGRTYKNQIFFWFMSEVYLKSEETHLVKYQLLRPFSTKKSTSKSGTGKDYFTHLRSSKDQADHKKGMLSNQP
jgi:hypothetical protein